MNFIKALPQVLEEYGIQVTTERILSDGDVIAHFELQSPHWVVMKDDARITFWTNDALITYIEFVLGEGNE
jgi:hypothetical protein